LKTSIDISLILF